MTLAIEIARKWLNKIFTSKIYGPAHPTVQSLAALLTDIQLEELRAMPYLGRFEQYKRKRIAALEAERRKAGGTQ